MENDPFKLFKAVLVVNWKSGAMRVTKKKPNKTNPWEIPVEIELKINVPQQPTIKAKGEIDIPETKVKEMFIEAL